jgi:type I restriction enzyme S subunit
MASGEIHQRYVSQTAEKITQAALRESNARILPVGSVMIALNGQGKTRGKAAILRKEMACNQSLAAIIPREPNVPEHFLFLFESMYSQLRNLTGDDARNGLNLSILRALRVDLPPPREQSRIAEILCSVDDAIAATRAVIEQTRKVRQGVLERLLTKGVGHTRFKQTEIGEIPEGWSVATFGEIFKLTSGKLKSVKSLAAGESDATPYPAYGGNGIAGYSSEFLVDGDLIVIGRVGEYCGSAYRSSGKAWITDNALYTKDFLAEVDRDFLAYAFSRVPLKNIRGGGGQPLVSQTAIYAQMLALPSLGEQKQIVEILKSFDTAGSELQLAKLMEIKSALMSDLLTGRKRVTEALPMAAE